MNLPVVSRATALIGGLFVLLSNAPAQAGPFASRPEIPAEMADTYTAKAARESVIPEASRVGIPAYPGAVIIRTFAVDERPPKYEGLPIIEMITADDYQTVIDFYKQRLPSWRNAELLSAYYFAQYGNLNFFKPEEPHVGIHKLENYYRAGEKKLLRKLLPGAQTLIKVFYAREEPKQEAPAAHGQP
ncbi:MAG TPA: hypothetical protein ENI97_05960 [Gammaproteobacteria bacterium]|nr:hypothetical protein [Gammaproteobacteria bacterium]